MSLAFETKTGNGKLMVCSIEMKDKIEERPVTKQLLISVLKYMNSNSFNSQIKVEAGEIKALLN